MRSTRSRKVANKQMNLFKLVEADPPGFDIKKIMKRLVNFQNY